MANVAHVLRNFKEMKGRSLLEKKLNAYLTHSLVGTRDQQHDECYKYAKEFVQIAKTTALENRRVLIYNILLESFNQGTDAIGQVVPDLGEAEAISIVASGVEAILALEMPYYYGYETQEN